MESWRKARGQLYYRKALFRLIWQTCLCSNTAARLQAGRAPYLIAPRIPPGLPAGLGAHFCGPWRAHLGSLGAHFWSPGAHFWAPWGSFLEALGLIFEALGSFEGPRGALWGQKIDLPNEWHDFWAILGAFGAHFGSPGAHFWNPGGTLLVSLELIFVILVRKT